MADAARADKRRDTTEESISPVSASSQTVSASSSTKPSPPLNWSSRQTASAEPTPEHPYSSLSSHDRPQKPQGEPSASCFPVMCPGLPGNRPGAASQNTANTPFPMKFSEADVNVALILCEMRSAPTDSSLRPPSPRQSALRPDPDRKDPDETEVYESDVTLDQPEEDVARAEKEEEEIFWGLQDVTRHVGNIEWRHRKLVPRDRSGTAYETEEEQTKRDSGIDKHALAEEFRVKAEVQRKPSKDIEKATKAAEAAAGFPDGVPEDKQRGVQYLNSVIRLIVKSGTERNRHWPQAEANRKEVERMGSVTLEGSSQEPQSIMQRCARVQRREERRNTAGVQYRGRAQPQSSRRKLRRSPELSKVTKQGERGMNQAETNTQQPHPAQPNLGSVSREDNKVEDIPSVGSGPVKTNNHKPKQHRRVINELASSFNEGVCEPLFDEKGGRARKKPQNGA